MKNAINYGVLFLVPIMAATACKKDVTPGEEPAPGKGAPVVKPPATNKYNDVVETKSPVQRGITATVNSNIGGFHIGLPALYDSTTKKYPLIVFIHGTGEKGNGGSQLPAAGNIGIARLIKDKKFPPNFKVNNKNYSFIVVSPQIKSWDYNTNNMARDVNDMINYTIARYRIDVSRIYVSGLSMGGGFTWDYASVYASKVAAIVPICGAAGPDATKVRNIANGKVAIWAFHNNDDKVVLPGNSTGFVNQINALNPGIRAKLTLWPTGGHDAWTKALNPSYKENNMNVYEWMLQYNK